MQQAIKPMKRTAFNDLRILRIVQLSCFRNLTTYKPVTCDVLTFYLDFIANAQEQVFSKQVKMAGAPVVVQVP
jgi:hypothetical protein